MEFEIVEAYEIRPTKEGPSKGWSLHVYFPEWGIDVRGLKLSKLKNGWYLQMPTLNNFDIDENKFIRYPVISFVEREKTRDLIIKIKEKAIVYVQEKIALEMAEKEKTVKEKGHKSK